MVHAANMRTGIMMPVPSRQHCVVTEAMATGRAWTFHPCQGLLGDFLGLFGKTLLQMMEKRPQCDN